MKKIPCLFERDFSDRRKPVLLNKVTPGCEWVLAGEGVASRKWDGTACLVRGGKLFKRYDAKLHPKTKQRQTPPAGWEPCEPEPDAVTGHWPGWVPVGDEPESQWHRSAWRSHAEVGAIADGTYELIGPKIGGNPEKLNSHVFARHGIDETNPPRTFEGLRDFLAPLDIEGIVFHHTDGRMAKIRKADYGLPRVLSRPPTESEGGEG